LEADVFRTNGTYGNIGVEYYTSDNTAAAGSDYIAASGILTFRDGETEKSFEVTVINEDYEGTKTVIGDEAVGNTDIFEAMANKYDTHERIKIAQITSNAIREYIVNGKEKSAIDFGCGTGLIGMNLLNDFHSVVFLDTSQNMLEQIKQKIADANIRNAETLCFDFETSVRSNIRADYIFMAQVLLHIADVEPVLSRLYKVLNSEGHLLVIDFNKNEAVISDKVHNGFDQKKLIDLMTKIGYKETKSKTFYTGNKIFMNQDASLFILDAKK
jgi:ubiquinone/menaquinone biosynthesis C-methylase UbiE